MKILKPPGYGPKNSAQSVSNTVQACDGWLVCAAYSRSYRKRRPFWVDLVLLQRTRPSKCKNKPALLSFAWYDGKAKLPVLLSPNCLIWQRSYSLTRLTVVENHCAVTKFSTTILAFSETLHALIDQSIIWLRKIGRSDSGTGLRLRR